MPPARPNESAPIALTAMKPDDVPLQPTGCTPLPVRRWRQGQWHEAQDLVAQERPVALEYNGLSHAVMLATPDDLADFALGFSLTEGLVDRAEQVYGIDINDSPAGITVRIEVASACFARFKDQRRSLAGRTGCGLCGAENLAQAVRQVKPVSSTARFSPQALSRGMGQLRARQPLLSATGATHAAGWCDASGQLQLAREDVGRHNALDKLIGWALATGKLPLRDYVLLVSGRVSYELVQKAVVAELPFIAAVGAPSSLAVELAERFGITLVGFLRPDAMNVYAHAARIVG